MQAFENRVQAEISAGKIPGSVAVARNTTGTFSQTYSTVEKAQKLTT
jgi:hypothetical protein